MKINFYFDEIIFLLFFLQYDKPRRFFFHLCGPPENTTAARCTIVNFKNLHSDHGHSADSDIAIQTISDGPS